jgi:hypothetical protein
MSLGREAHRLRELLHGDRLLPAHVGHAAQQWLCHLEGVRGQGHGALAPVLSTAKELRVRDHLVDEPQPQSLLGGHDLARDEQLHCLVVAQPAHQQPSQADLWDQADGSNRARSEAITRSQAIAKASPTPAPAPLIAATNSLSLCTMSRTPSREGLRPPRKRARRPVKITARIACRAAKVKSGSGGWPLDQATARTRCPLAGQGTGSFVPPEEPP